MYDKKSEPLRRHAGVLRRLNFVPPPLSNAMALPRSNRQPAAPSSSAEIAATSSQSGPSKAATVRKTPDSASSPESREGTPFEDDNEDGYAASEEEIIQRPQKRAKPKSRTGLVSRGNGDGPLPKLRGSRGILRKMNDTPLDVLFEVCASAFLILVGRSFPDLLVSGAS